jgi:hypothetical protein
MSWSIRVRSNAPKDTIVAALNNAVSHQSVDRLVWLSDGSIFVTEDAEESGVFVVEFCGKKGVGFDERIALEVGVMRLAFSEMLFNYSVRVTAGDDEVMSGAEGKWSIIQPSFASAFELFE